MRIGDFNNSLEEINSTIENRIRVFFHLIFSLHFGPNYSSKLPPQIQDRINNLSKKGPISIRRNVDQNLFYHFSRSEYAEIVNNKNFWNNLFEKQFFPKTREEVVTALKLTFSLDDRKQHRDRKDYFRNMRESIRKSIINADWLLASLSNVIQLSIDPAGLIDEEEGEYHKVRFSFFGQDRVQSSTPWKIAKMKKIEIENRLLQKNRTVNFADDLAVSTLFGGTLAEIFVTIAMLQKEKKVEVEKLPEGNMYFRIIPKKS